MQPSTLLPAAAQVGTVTWEMVVSHTLGLCWTWLPLGCPWLLLATAGAARPGRQELMSDSSTQRGHSTSRPCCASGHSTGGLPGPQWWQPGGFGCAGPSWASHVAGEREGVRESCCPRNGVVVEQARRGKGFCCWCCKLKIVALLIAAIRSYA